MAHLTADLATVRSNLDRVQAEVAEACVRGGRSPGGVRICVATKYVDNRGLEILRQAGVEVAGENRLQDMIAKQEQFGDDFEWHFIGAIQSRKIREIAARSTMIHSLATTSARDKLGQVENLTARVLVQVNIAGEDSKQGVAPEALPDFLAGCNFPVAGLMTMPPATSDPEQARPYFAQLAQLAAAHSLTELSIGTSQDFGVAVEEGATLIRIGSTLFSPLDQ